MHRINIYDDGFEIDGHLAFAFRAVQYAIRSFDLASEFDFKQEYLNGGFRIESRLWRKKRTKGR